MAEANLGSARGRIEIDADGAVRAFDETEAAAQGFLGTLDKHSQTLDKTGKVMLGIGAAALGGLGLAASTAANFEEKMNRVGAVSGATGDDFEKLGDLAKELGTTTRFSASEAADGMSYLAMAGFSTNEVLSAMPGTLNLAAAGQLELAEAADIASNVLTGFGLEAEDIGRVNDTMAKTASSANTDISQLGQAMSFVAPVAAASGVSIEEASAAIGKMSDAGIQGSRAGTTLRQVIARIENPTTQAADAIEDLGIKTHDSSGQLLPIIDIVKQFEEAGLSTADAMEIFGARAGPGMMALVSQGSDALQELTTDLEESGGAAQTMAERQMEGLNGALTEMKSAIEGALIAVGEELLPMLEQWTDHITKLVQWFASLSPQAQKFIAIGSALAGVFSILGGVTLMFLARLPLIIAGIKSLGTAFAFLSGPVGIIIAAIAALAAGVIYLWNNNEAFRKAVMKAWEWIQDAVAQVVDWFVANVLPRLEAAWEAIQAAAKAVAEWFTGTLVPWLQEAWDTISSAVQTIVQAFKTAWNAIQEAARPVIAWFQEHVVPVFQSLGNLLKAIWDKVVADFTAAWQVFQAVWQAVGQPIVDGIRIAFKLLQVALKVVFQGTIAAFQQLWSQVRAVWEAIGPPIIAVMKGAWQQLKNVISLIWNSIRIAIETVLGVIKGIIDAVTAAIKGDWGAFWTAIKDIVSVIWEGIKGLVGVAVNFMKDTVVNAISTLSDVWNSIWSQIEGYVKGVWSGIKSLVQSAINTVKGTIQGALDLIRAIWESAWETVKRLLSNAWDSIRDAVSDGVDNVLQFIKDLPGNILDALGDLGSLLFDSGKEMIRGLIDGIKNMAGNVKDAVGDVMSGARDLLPFSPAKEGPFSGRGWTLYSGRSMINALAEGMDDEKRRAIRSTESIAGALAAAFQGALSDPAVRTLGVAQAMAPAASGAAMGAQPSVREGDKVYQFYGDISLPNVSDADSFFEELEHVARSRSR